MYTVSDVMLYEKYWFYLSLETSVCTDYVTEQFYNLAMANLVVPIVSNDQIYRF